MSFEDLTPEQKESLKGEQGIQGLPGEKVNQERKATRRPRATRERKGRQRRVDR